MSISTAPNRAVANLPPPRRLVASLISGLPKTQEALPNPLTQAPGYKDSLLTLHVLFPNELLPALDLLDRGLVTRIHPAQSKHPASSGGTPQLLARQQHDTASPGHTRETVQSAIEHDAQDPTQVPRSPQRACTYYVRSAQQQQAPRGNSRYRNAAYEHTTYYEVRLDAWSCSCPAFAFSAFPALLTSDHDILPPLPDAQHDDPNPQGWRFGGLSLGNDMAVCKHLLACVLVEHSSTFAHFVEERVTTVEEMAGWAAGWAD